MSKHGQTEAGNEPDTKLFKLKLSVPSGKSHKPHALFNGKFNGRWSAELEDGVSATVQRDAGGQWLLTLRRGRESSAFYPVTTTRKPWELCYWLPSGWFGPTCEVFVTL
jgi:hypothetical protein